jgi:hypothetical protein
VHKILLGMILAFCFIAVVVNQARAQTRKAGLWEITTTQTYQQSPFPSGASPSGGTHTTEVCLTQQQIEKYGANVPQLRGCQITNVVKKPGGMTADMICTGFMNGKGELESSSNDGIHATGKIHFVGSIKTGSDAKPVEWTSESSSIFKKADCGDVKPIPMPDK